MKRRKFLFLTIAGAIATTTPFCRSRRNTAALAQPQFLSTLCDISTISQIGADYRKLTPAEDNKRQLEDLLATGLSPTADPCKQLSTTATTDYTAGRIVTIDGWIISVTEARQCALYSLRSA